MKKALIAGLLAASILIFVPAAANAGGFSFRLFGGGNYLAGGDLNKGLQGWADYWKASRGYQGYTQQAGSFNPVHLGFDAGADIVFNLTPNWGVGFGMEYLLASKTSNFTFQSATQTIQWEYLGKPSALPVKVSVFYFLPLSDKLTLGFHAGAGYYWANARLESRQDINPNIEYIIDSSAKGVGFHGGISLEMKLGPGVNFLLEAAGRYAAFSGFTGKVTISGDGGWEGTLRYWEANTSYLDNYAYIDLTGAPPTGSSIKLVRDAKIDFSGVSLRAGIVIRL
ncbi:MAG: hypothetical protein ACYDH3_10740 [Candidatus Aminicenantales bacterium]